MQRRLAWLTALALLVLLPPAVHGVSGWHLSRSPSHVDQGEQQVFTLRATDKDGSGDIGCVILLIPSAFSVQNAVVTGTSTNGPWAATRTPVGSSTRVRVFSVGGASKLKEDDWVEVNVTVTGVTVGSHKWTGNVTQGDDCTGDPFLPQIDLSIGVKSGTTPPPTPAPTPPPTPAPTKTPKPAATPTRPPTPVPTRTPGPDSNPRPTAPPPAATSSVAPGVTPGPSASSTAEPSLPPPLATAPGPSAALGGTNPAEQPTDGIDVPLAGLEASGLSAMGFLGDGYAWFVPAFVAGVPGVLLILIVVLQLVGGAMWAPAVRRLRGDGQRSRRPRDRGRATAGSPAIGGIHRKY